jgi:hypothetical protein
MKRIRRQLIAIIISALLTSGCSWNLIPRSHAQEKTDPPVVNQHFKVIPDVSAASLQEELEKLNKEGYYINDANLYVVDGKFTIVVSDSNIASNDSDCEQEDCQ